jgi:hypothetical protein
MAMVALVAWGSSQQGAIVSAAPVSSHRTSLVRDEIFDKCDACGVVGQEILAELDRKVLSKAAVGASGGLQVKLSVEKLMEVLEAVCDKMAVRVH